MLKTLLVSQYSTRPAGVLRKKNRYISGMNAIERIMACCCGSSVGMVAMRWLRNELTVISSSRKPGMAKLMPGIWKTSGWPRLGNHRKGLLKARSAGLIGGVTISVTSIKAGSHVTTAWAEL